MPKTHRAVDMHLVIEGPTVEQIEALAQAEDRSRANMIRELLREGVKVRQLRYEKANGTRVPKLRKA